MLRSKKCFRAQGCSLRRVSILVLVDVALEVVGLATYLGQGRVSILVLVDVALEDCLDYIQ